MIDKNILKKVLSEYKSDFLQGQWDDERFKWEAVKWFQDNWDIDADHFSDMLELSLKQTNELLAASYYYPRQMITFLAEKAENEVKNMFAVLFDESRDIYDRIEFFKEQSDILLQKYGNGQSNHYQTENAVSTYLWLRYPDRYYIYKISEARTVSKTLHSNYQFKNGAYKQNLENFLSMYDEICEEIGKDRELTALLNNALTESCYPDKEYRTLTVDVGFYISQQKKKPEELRDKEDDKMNESQARYRKWFAPIVDTLYDMGGEGSRQDVHQEIIKRYHISEQELNIKNQTVPKVLNDIDWARNSLSYEGIIDKNADRGLWKLTELGRKIKMTDSLAGKIITKWVRINTAKRNHEEIPVIDLSRYYEYRNDEYTKENFLSEVFMDEADYNSLVNSLKHRKNLIMQGAPGVGKTFAAKRLAYSMMGEKDDARVRMIQFHQNYTYEDFVLGYRPKENGFSLEKGIFYHFCEEAEKHGDKDYFFIIDEINRGNLSKIFGELLMLIEKEHRDEKIMLSYNGELFSVPGNLFIIGMMNTADRSLTMVDYALRRRFSFFPMEPAFDNTGFKSYQRGINSAKLDAVINVVKEMNTAIKNDSTLGKGFCIGHSYFCDPTECADDEQLRIIVEYDIIPTIEEYWFDNEAELNKWKERLLGVF